MSDINTTIVLGSKRYKSAINTDLTVDIPLVNNQKEIDEFDRSDIVDLSQIFDDERQGSNIFRLTTNVDLIFYNAYSGTTGAFGYTPFTNNLYYVNSESSFNTNNWSGYPQYYEFDFIRNDNNVSGYTINSGTTPPHISFINKSASTYNWTQYVSYAYENEYNKILQYNLNSVTTLTWVCGNGIPFYIVNPFNYDGRDLISFVCPVEHNLSVGEFVEIEFDFGWSGYNGNKVFQVYSLGNYGYNSDKYIFNLYNNGFTGNTFFNLSQGTFKRIIDINNSAETMSKYYVRKHKIITNVGDSILTKCGFEQNIFNIKRQYEFGTLTPDKVSRITQKEGSQSYLLSFSRDIDISKYRDNLNRPLTELFITVINNGYFGWMNKPIANNISIREGYQYNLGPSVSSYWDYTNGSVNLSTIPTASYTKPGGFTFYYNQNLKSGDTINGDYCEFNQFEQKERIISQLYHKISFNENLFIIQSATTNPNGYYYKPHNLIQLRVYSDYLEEGSLNEIDNVPYYSYYSNYKNTFIWRDLYTYGFIDESGRGVNYPFLNGTHYPSTKIIFRLIPEGNVGQNITTISDPITDDCE
jgi:hypothetical protein